MGVEEQIRPASSEAVHALIARDGLVAVRWEDQWDWDNRAGPGVLGIHAPEPRVSTLVETRGADDDGALDTPAAEPSP